MTSDRQKNKTTIFRKESLERLSSPEQLDQIMQVVNPKSWLPLVALGAVMGFALLWGILGRIPITATGRGLLVYPSDSTSELVGLAYFNQGEGDRIQPGMSIILVPETATSERVGGILGHVREVSKPGIMTLKMAREAPTADATESHSDVIEVLVELEEDPSSPSGYRWSSRGGSGLTLSAGITATARVTLEEKAPITIVFPFLDRN
ncbi:MAG TPA: hypothetical protein ACFE0H_16135 [Elainellaceae cyanobacterium]